MPDDTLFDPATAVAHLAERGLVDPATARARALGGGVSNIVLAVEDATRRLVLKQSLPRLRVADEWLAPQGRILAEAAALEVAGRLVPGSVPRVVDRDPGRHAVVLEHAPPGWGDWKADLLAGRADAGVARRVGEVVGTLHASTLGGAGLPPGAFDGDSFELLRVDPYYRTTARRAPEVAAAVLDLAERMTARRTCLVHGDLSPKNVLTGPAGPTAPAGSWVIDFEVAHVGDPAFDVAFLLTHLTMKSVHAPAHRAAYDACAVAFADAYTAAAGPALAVDWPYALGHVAALLLARVRGKSPAEYLTPADRRAVWSLGTTLLADSAERPDLRLADLAARRDEVTP